MTDRLERPVLVAGAGIGGLAAAAALRREGIPVEVFERASNPVPERGTGLTLWGNAIQVLDRLGCGEAVRAAGGVVDRTEIRSAGGRLLIDTPIADTAREVGAPDSYVVRRRDLLQALYDARGDVPVHVDKEATEYRVESGGVTLCFADGSSARGSALVCADGARSALRAQMLADGEAIPLGSPIWRGISDADGGLRPGIAVLVWGHTGGGIGGGHIRDGHVSWTIAVNSATERELDANPGRHKEILLRFVDGLDDALTGAVRTTPDDDIISAHVLVRRPSPRWGEGPVTLLGDAAHAMPTAFGQGGCQALEDALSLAVRVAEAGDLTDGLRSYETHRQQRVNWLRERIERVDRFSRVENRFVCGLRDLVVPLVPQKGSIEMWRRIMTLEP